MKISDIRKIEGIYKIHVPYEGSEKMLEDQSSRSIELLKVSTLSSTKMFGDYLVPGKHISSMGITDCYVFISTDSYCIPLDGLYVNADGKVKTILYGEEELILNICVSGYVDYDAYHCKSISVSIKVLENLLLDNYKKYPYMVYALAVFYEQQGSIEKALNTYQIVEYHQKFLPLDVLGNSWIVDLYKKILSFEKVNEEEKIQYETKIKKTSIKARKEWRGGGWGQRIIGLLFILTLLVFLILIKRGYIPDYIIIPARD